jgi:hypothetical protein
MTVSGLADVQIRRAVTRCPRRGESILVYVRAVLPAHRRADVRPEAQEAAAVARLPAGASHEVIRDVTLRQLEPREESWPR